MEETLEIVCAFVAMTLLSTLGAPRLWLCGIAGLLLHPVPAFVVSVASALLGNYALFAACRGHLAQQLVDWIATRRATSKIKLPSLKVGISGVVLMRQVPGPCALITVFLARTNVLPRDFLIGSFLGFLPTTLLTILLTGTAARYLPPHIVTWTTAALALAAATVWLLKNRSQRLEPR